MNRLVGEVTVHGVDVGPETRCVHYDSPLDVVALRLGCCERFYPCLDCHDEVADHESQPWPGHRFDDSAVLCGVCETTLTPVDYLDAEHSCPNCAAVFNPGCETHYSRYFEL